MPKYAAHAHTMAHMALPPVRRHPGRPCGLGAAGRWGAGTYTAAGLSPRTPCGACGARGARGLCGPCPGPSPSPGARPSPPPPRGVRAAGAAPGGSGGRGAGCHRPATPLVGPAPLVGGARRVAATDGVGQQRGGVPKNGPTRGEGGLPRATGSTGPAGPSPPGRGSQGAARRGTRATGSTGRGGLALECRVRGSPRTHSRYCRNCGHFCLRHIYKE